MGRRFFYRCSGLLVIIILGSFITWQLNTSSQIETAAPLSLTESEIEELYGPLIPIFFGHVQMRASVADTTSTRQQGLSGTPALPLGIVKLFVFEDLVLAPFWMKDMNYPIDILWLDASKKIIFVASKLTPETYPTTYGPDEPSQYVIETPAGMANSEGMDVGDSFVW